MFILPRQSVHRNTHMTNYIENKATVFVILHYNLITFKQKIASVFDF